MTEETEKPKKSPARLKRRDVLGGAGAVGALSVIPEAVFAEPSHDDRLPSSFQEWKPIQLDGNRTVRLNGVSHTEAALQEDMRVLWKRVEDASIVILEGGLSEEVRLLAKEIAYDPNSQPHPFETIKKHVKSEVLGVAFYGGLMAMAFLKGKRVFVIDPDYNCRNVGEIVHILSTFYAVFRISSWSKRKAGLLRDAVVIDYLSHMKIFIVEFLGRTGMEHLRQQVLTFDNHDLLRLAWDAFDWRDSRVGTAIRNLPKIDSTAWVEGGRAEIFRGAGHGSALQHYLKSPVESSVKKALYPHYELMAALFGVTNNSDRSIVQEATLDGYTRYD